MSVIISDVGRFVANARFCFIWLRFCFHPRPLYHLPSTSTTVTNTGIAKQEGTYSLLVARFMSSRMLHFRRYVSTAY